jgi:hypothetical protein
VTRKSRPRTERRAAERDARKLTRDLERLAALERGGAPEHPLDVTSASQVDVYARDAKCAVCGNATRLEEHTAETIDGVRLRVAHVRCQQCGRKRAIYFKLLSAMPN